jgi:hypothetical protein
LNQVAAEFALRYWVEDGTGKFLAQQRFERQLLHLALQLLRLGSSIWRRIDAIFSSFSRTADSGECGQ